MSADEVAVAADVGYRRLRAQRERCREWDR